LIKLLKEKYGHNKITKNLEKSKAKQINIRFRIFFRMVVPGTNFSQENFFDPKKGDLVPG
jgi:hypothetical protein